MPIGRGWVAITRRCVLKCLAHEFGAWLPGEPKTEVGPVSGWRMGKRAAYIQTFKMSDLLLFIGIVDAINVRKDIIV
ncbi:hypothetical protein RUE5091_01587 [Ruegeria denitrificans]|uniref:Uncharacterized protein n=1 Tax=Ruegeria denitrificans TaxID=1715692 RepID=A0A0P1IQC2_9RHOB|nr:hypothetical protein RUE5091_01587 [Ruegeria denitrificans]